MPDTVLLAFALGFAAASPVGPVGLLCLRRTLAQGGTTGLYSALGVASAYALWSYVAIHGLSALSGLVEEEEILLQTGIGLFFLLYGLHTLFNAPDTRYPVPQRKDAAAAFLSTFLIVLLNPATFLTFSALFALFGVARNSLGPFASLETALSVFAGAAAFWVLVTRLIQCVRGGVRDVLYQWVHRLASQVILAFGLAILVYSVYGAVAAGTLHAREGARSAAMLRR